MNDSLFSTKDIVKCLIVAGLIYSILKMIPAEQMNNKDIIASTDAVILKIKFDLFFLPISLKMRKLSSRARKIIL